MKQLIPVQMYRIRQEKGMNRAQLARAAKMQAGTITMIESGRLIPYESQLAKIAAALNVKDPDSLLEPLEVVADGCDAA